MKLQDDLYLLSCYEDETSLPFIPCLLWCLAKNPLNPLKPVLLIEESLDVVWRFIYVLVTCDCACAELCSDNCFDMY